MTEAEYVAAAARAQEALWLRLALLTNEAGIGIEQVPPELWIDSEGARKLANNPVHHRKTKHIDKRYHFIREIVEKKEIELSWVPGKENWANLLTKRITGPELSRQRIALASCH